jgi:hypothetical protein
MSQGKRSRASRERSPKNGTVQDSELEITVHPVIEAAVEAYGLGSTRDFLEAVARFGRPEGGDSEPGRDAILRYEKKDRALSESFALLMLDYLDTHPEVKNSSAQAVVRKKCREVTRTKNARSHRHNNPPRTDPASVSFIPSIKGVYAIIRPDTGEPFLLQDILVLDHVAKGDGGNFATLLSPRVVSRGTWCVMKHTIHSTMAGHRAQFSGDIVTFGLARGEGDNRLFGGVLLGASTDYFLPVIVPVIAIKISDNALHPNFYKLGNENDARLMQLYSKLETKMKEMEEGEVEIIKSALRLVLPVGETEENRRKIGMANDASRGVIIDPSRGMMNELRRKFPNPESLILPDVLKFVGKDPTKFDDS